MEARRQLDTILHYFYIQKDESRTITLNTIEEDKNLLSIAGSLPELQRIISKLKRDNYLHIYPAYPSLPDGKDDISNGLRSYCMITFDGRLFWENGGYAKEAKRQKIIDFPKNYWWAIAAISFIIGFFADVIKERLKQKTPPTSNQAILTIPTSADSEQSHKILPVLYKFFSALNR
jgi:hypothetical protein